MLTTDEQRELDRINATHNVHISDADIARYKELKAKASQPTPVVVPDETIKENQRMRQLLVSVHEWAVRPTNVAEEGIDSGDAEFGSIAEFLTAQPAPLPSGDKNTFEEVLINRAGEYRDMEREHRRREEHEAACTCSDKASGINVSLKLFRLWNASKEPAALPVEENVSATGTLDGYPFEVHKNMPPEAIYFGTKSAAYLVVKYHSPLPVGQKETFEEWRRSPEACAIFAKYAPGFAAPMIKAAKAAWNAAKGQKETK